MPWIHPTGGLVYHARALSAGRRWSGFRASIGDWLRAWQPPTEKLLIVGPSGGYTLPSDWLSRFSEVVAIDFDPLAKRIFRSRHRGCRLSKWITEDVFPVHARGIDWLPLGRRLLEFPDHAVLFSNVLGQVSLAADSDRASNAIERELATLRTVLGKRHWASYHDRLSGSVRPKLPADRRYRSDAAIARDVFAGAREVCSYSTASLGRGLECDLFSWECQRGHWHLIEAIRGEAARAEAVTEMKPASFAMRTM